jgi:hypothetical protein
MLDKYKEIIAERFEEQIYYNIESFDYKIDIFLNSIGGIMVNNLYKKIENYNYIYHNILTLLYIKDNNNKAITTDNIKNYKEKDLKYIKEWLKKKIEADDKFLDYDDNLMIK